MENHNDIIIVKNISAYDHPPNNACQTKYNKMFNEPLASPYYFQLTAFSEAAV